ncbi:hypothetical protein KIW84_015830 [Lathyrus oleraceus]|uniref:ATP-dependent DNA helicase n=1 Tax=Pisum sativum TaxID=3888 RepID=A0A9D5BRM9_PEA|nr:hypothetical protein KIW84_015830 [Pisum sativum]
MLLKDLNELLNLHGKKIEDYDLPSLPPNTIDKDAIPSIIQEELAVDIPNEDIESIAKLNNDQMIAFKTIMNVIVQKHSGVFFVDGPGGTSKTFIYRTIMTSLRSRGEIVLATASFGIAATLLPDGRTAHSRFKIPVDIQPSSICAIQKQKDLANLIRVTATIIWVEAPMTNQNCLEALDRSLQDICSNSAPFGGKVLIMERDFRQVLPIVRKSTKAQVISACIVQSHLWNHTKILRLRQNMRSLHDQEFAEFLIRIGDGVEPTKPDDTVRLPLHIAIPWEGEHSIQVLIQHIVPNLELHGWDAPYMVSRSLVFGRGSRKDVDDVTVWIPDKEQIFSVKFAYVELMFRSAVAPTSVEKIWIAIVSWLGPAFELSLEDSSSFLFKYHLVKVTEVRKLVSAIWLAVV